MKTEYHFICKVEDTINDNRIVIQTYCDVTTPKIAEAFFKADPNIKKHLGNSRYKISFRQNSIIIQD